MQIRTGRIGLVAFLNKARVPDFPSPVCQCGRARETAQHIIVHCDRFTAARNKLADPRTGGVDLKSLLSSAAGAQRLAKWFIQLSILPQFQLAGELIYGEEQPDSHEDPAPPTNLGPLFLL